MMYYKYIAAFIFLISISSFSNREAYKIYTKKGEEVAYGKMVEAMKDADIILFGEIHNNAISHWMELSLLKDLSQEKKQLIIGAEMFEADDQLKVDEFLQGKITVTHLSNEAKVWDNFSTDYKPLLEFSALSKLKFIATNIPRRYASLVAREGLASLNNLSEEAKRYIAPLPVEVDLTLPGYKELDMGNSPHGKGMGGMAYLPEAQAIKDATMAHFILKNWEKGKVFLHFNGSYHSQNYEGIYWFLKKRNPELKIVTIGCAEQESVDKLEQEQKGAADFIIVIPSDMTKTY